MRNKKTNNKAKHNTTNGTKGEKHNIKKADELNNAQDGVKNKKSTRKENNKKVGYET